MKNFESLYAAVQNAAYNTIGSESLSQSIKAVIKTADCVADLSLKKDLLMMAKNFAVNPRQVVAIVNRLEVMNDQ